MNKPQYLVIHHTAVSYDKNPNQFDATDTYHEGKGFPKSSLGFYVGYHAMVEKDGSIRISRRDTDDGAHTSQDGVNFKSLALCFTGDFDKEEPTLAQCKTAMQWITSKQESYKIPNNKVLPHRHWAPKTCWGSKVPDDVIGYLRVRLTPENNTPSPWAVEAFKAAANFGYSNENPREIIGTKRLRHAMVKHPEYIGCIADKDEDITYEEWITANYKAGFFTKT